MEYFNGNDNAVSLKITGAQSCSIDILSWEENNRSWKQKVKESGNKIKYEVHGLNGNNIYQLLINNKPIKKYTASLTGVIHFDCPANANFLRIEKVRNNN